MAQQSAEWPAFGPETALRGNGMPPEGAERGIDSAAEGADRLLPHAIEIATFLKALGHDGRLMILCHLASGPKSVTELENLLSSRQAVVSQQLARLRFEGLVSARRDKQTIFYSILDPRVPEMIACLLRLYGPRD